MELDALPADYPMHIQYWSLFRAGIDKWKSSKRVLFVPQIKRKRSAVFSPFFFVNATKDLKEKALLSPTLD